MTRPSLTVGETTGATRIWSVAANRWYKVADPQTRFWEKVDRRGPDECWLWMAAVGRGGYGRFGFQNHHWICHRLAWIWANGPVPNGLILDHLCRNRRCVNPSHLEPVTYGVNLLRGDTFNARNARKTECLRGHPLSGDNVYAYAGRRICRQCRRERPRRHGTRAA